MTFRLVSRKYATPHIIFAVLLSLSACLGTRAQQSDPIWTTRFGGPGINASSAAIAADQQGDVYVIANVNFASPAHEEVVTVKYSSTGVILWKAWLGSAAHPAQAIDIGVDSSGNIYTLAAIGNPSATSNLQNSEFATAKYSPDGARQWIQYVPPSPGGSNFPFKLAIAPAAIYITGTAAVAGNSTAQVLTVKYDPTGATIWSRRNPATAAGINSPAGFALDSTENVYIAVNSTHFVPTIFKLDSDGNLLNSVSPPNFPSFRAFSIDSSDNVYVAGCFAPGPEAAKFDPNGNLLWTHIFAPTRCFSDIHGQGSDGLLLAETISPQSTSSSRVALAKLDSNGAQQWEILFGFRPSFAQNLAVLDNTNIAVLTDVGSGKMTAPGFLEATQDGKQLPAPVLSPDSADLLIAFFMAAGPNHVVFITGSAIGSSSIELYTAAFAHLP